MRDRRALITGITGQDGSYLAELLLLKGYEVHGLIRRASTFNTVADQPPLRRPARRRSAACSCTTATSPTASDWSTLLAEIRPDEVYHLAAQSHVRVSFDEPSYTGDTTGLGTIRLLEAIRIARTRLPLLPGVVVRDVRRRRRRRRTRRRRSIRAPRTARPSCTPTGSTRNYREAYGMFAVNGILFNHESPRRGETFVTRKITRAVAAHQAAGASSELYLGNLDAVRDWGYAPEYVEGMWRMLQPTSPTTTCSPPATAAPSATSCRRRSSYVGLDWEKHVRFDERYLRPTEVDALIGDARRAEERARLEGDGRRRRAGPHHGRRRPRPAPSRVDGPWIDRPSSKPGPS